MDPVTIAASISALSALFQGISAGKNRRDAEAAWEEQLATNKQAAALWDSLIPPQYQNMSPFLVMESIVDVDPTSRNYQMDAIEELADYGDDGMTADTKYQMGLIENRQLQADRGAREGIIQNANMRGVGGSGLELASQLMAQQNSANQANMSGLQQAAEAENRKMGAVGQLGQQAGQLRGMDMGQAEARANIARFNANASTDAAKYNNALLGQAFDDKRSIVGGKSSALTGVANTYGNTGNRLSDTADTKSSNAWDIGNKGINDVAKGVSESDWWKKKYGE